MATARMCIQLTRRGFLATLLLQANPDAEWKDLEDIVERIAARGDCQSAAETELMILANVKVFAEKNFPDGGRSS